MKRLAWSRGGWWLNQGNDIEAERLGGLQGLRFKTPQPLHLSLKTEKFI